MKVIARVPPIVRRLQAPRLFIVLALAVQWTGGEGCGQGAIIMPQL
jgi:hypothetical protein